MAYAASDLIRIGGGSGRALWSYTTADAVGTVNTAGYFNSAAAMLNVYDVIILVSSTGGTPAVSHLYVNANDGSTVDVIDGVAITSTDSD